MGFLIHGIGTMVCGEREYWPDGSFITTEWCVLAWVPIIPLCSKRISYTRNSDFATYDVHGGYYVYESMGVNRRQALYVYCWLFTVLAPIALFAVSQRAIERVFDEDTVAGVCLALSGTAFVFPYFLRRWVKRRNLERWRRQTLGLHG